MAPPRPETCFVGNSLGKNLDSLEYRLRRARRPSDDGGDGKSGYRREANGPAWSNSVIAVEQDGSASEGDREWARRTNYADFVAISMLEARQDCSLAGRRARGFGRHLGLV